LLIQEEEEEEEEEKGQLRQKQTSAIKYRAGSGTKD
jgi:hypothetical protein